MVDLNKVNSLFQIFRQVVLMDPYLVLLLLNIFINDLFLFIKGFNLHNFANNHIKLHKPYKTLESELN